MNKLAAELAAILCRKCEGMYRGPYLCPAGVPTIGYGATYYEDGTRVALTDPVLSKTRIETLLMWHIRYVYLPSVRKLCPNITDAYKLAAIIDFTFNLGSARLKTSTLRKRINSEDWENVPIELRKWNKGGGRVLRGLTLRREAEIGYIEYE
jgi:lysozyme